MPDLSGNIEEIQNTLKASFSRGPGGIDQDVVARSKRVLMQNISFTPATTAYSLKCNELKAKYTSLNPSTSKQGWNGEQESHKSPANGKDMNSSNSDNQNGESLPSPKVILYPEEMVKMDWTRMPRIGAGLVNMGNTCFFNSTLQCLTYTAPLVNYCLTNDHRSKCMKKEFCMMCEIQSHIKTTLDYGGRSIKPHSMLQKLRCIAKHMKWGRQEDAHEFLRFVVDHLQQSCLSGETKLDRFSKETTVINQIFGGYLRSQVTCLRCQAKSNTFDPFMDLSLDIKGVNTLEEALVKFVKPEVLEQENAYKCPKCRNKVRAQKRFSIQKAPNVLTVQLNRFDFNRHLSGKIHRFIKYPERINLRNYMSSRQGEPVYYQLYGVLVHSGHSSDHGHYYSYVKSPSKTWYCMNDSIVHQAGHNSVFSADAYVLFYARLNKSTSVAPPSPKPTFSPSTKNSFIGPVLPNHVKEKPPMTNGVHGKPTSELGTPVQRQQPKVLPSSNGTKIVPHSSSSSSLTGSHQKISFPILTPLQKKQLQEKEDGRIVLKIKHGNSKTMEKYSDGQSKVVNGSISKLPWHPKTGLVPYNDDSDSEQENTNNTSTANSNKVAAKPSPHHSGGNNSVHSHSVQASGDNVPETLAVKKIHLPASNGSGDSSISNRDCEVSGKKQHLSPFVWEDDSPKALPSKSTSFNKENRGGDVVSNSSIPTKSSSLLTNRKFEDKISSAKQSLSALELPSTPILSSKVKSTTSNWSVQTQDGAPSPRGSCSSTNSVNSTSEWTVEAKGGALPSKLSKSNDRDPPNGLNSKHFSALSPSAIFPAKNGKLSSLPSKPETKHVNGDHKKNGSYHGDCSTTPVDISDKKHLLSPSSSQSSDSGSRKSKKNKNKHKKESKYEDTRNGSSSRSDSSIKKKKKYKREKEDKKKLPNRRYSSDSDDSSQNKSKKHKRSRRSSTSSSSDAGSSDAYEWVEKTCTVPRKEKPNKEASVQSWNHHIKDDLAPKKEEIRERKSNWDGARESKVAKNFNGSSQSYNSKVLSWDGSKSQLDKDLDSERASLKRRWADDYNEDLDSGKVKKTKNPLSDSGFSSYNPFQEYQSQPKEKHHSHQASSWSQDHSYHHQHDHHYHKKSSIQPHWQSYKNYQGKQKTGYKMF